jgi:hypothetical protein
MAQSFVVLPRSIVNVSGTIANTHVIFVQGTALSIWTISHNLNKLYPNVVLIDNNGDRFVAEIKSIDSNTIEVRTNEPTIGTAIISK